MARQQGRSVSRTVNDLLRAGLRAGQASRPEPYGLPTFDTGRPLVDVTDVAGALELLGDGRSDDGRWTTAGE
ncbi:MAG: hypothetical protein ACRD1K_04145 [Acidimicrobiales bacterium]